MSAKPIIVGCVVGGIMLLAGCYESGDVTLHKAGVYKGPTDPLLEKQRTAAQQEALLARFNQVQTDR